MFICCRWSPFHIGLQVQFSGLFGGSNVFLDGTGGHLGGRYPDRPRRRLGRSAVVIGVVHAGCVRDFDDGLVRDVRDGRGGVCEEIEGAFTKGRTIIRLLNGTPMSTATPAATDLPRSIRGFAHLQVHTIQDGHGFGALLDEVDAPATSATRPSERCPDSAGRPSSRCHKIMVIFAAPMRKRAREQREKAANMQVRTAVMRGLKPSSRRSPTCPPLDVAWRWRAWNR
ncbi:hypothetical protein [Lentzea atacamensis]|uniref:hypothetical protein n=1 Tax=Lentzea atacamensis TaxID=531938 RepID=UPI0011BEB753|nr:hypothetical protein [Lentzea atacamensis]